MHANKRTITFLVLIIFIQFAFMSTVIAQTGQSSLFDRIYAGDYVWSLNLPKQEPTLMAYGVGLYNEIQISCPGMISQSEIADVNFFFTNISGNNRYGVSVSQVFWQAVNVAGAYVNIQRRAKTEVETLKGASTCRGAKINRVAENTWRMLAGRRPLYRADSLPRSSLLNESVVPIDTYHYYPDIGNSLVGGTARRLFKDDVDRLKKIDMTILTCLYDEDSDDLIQEVQYYWGPSMVTLFAGPLPIIWQVFFEFSQSRMDEAMGSAGRGIGHVIHPFTTYGSARFECPSLRDQDLPMAQIKLQEKVEWPEGACRPVGNGLFECP